MGDAANDLKRIQTQIDKTVMQIGEMSSVQCQVPALKAPLKLRTLLSAHIREWEQFGELADNVIQLRDQLDEVIATYNNAYHNKFIKTVKERADHLKKSEAVIAISALICRRGITKRGDPLPIDQLNLETEQINAIITAYGLLD